MIRARENYLIRSVSHHANYAVDIGRLPSVDAWKIIWLRCSMKGESSAYIQQISVLPISVRIFRVFVYRGEVFY